MTPADAVVDCSAVAAVLFGEPEAESVSHSLRGRKLFAPTLLTFEIGNVALKRVSRKLLSVQSASEALQLFGGFAIDLVDCPLQDTYRIAIAGNLSFYDAAYLWLAEEMALPLITLDRRLAEAARALP